MKKWSVRAATATLAAALLAALVPWPAAGAVGDGGTLVVHTVPATPGAKVAFGGNVALTDSEGVARLEVPSVAGLDERFRVLSSRVTDDKLVTLDRIVGRRGQRDIDKPLVVGLRTERLVRWVFVDRGGREVPASEISLLEMRSSAGEVIRLRGSDLTRPRWLASGRTQLTPTGLRDKDLSWSVVRVVAGGAEVVNRGQQVFFPSETREWPISLLFYRAEFVGRDILFGWKTGEGVSLEGPDGAVVRTPFSGGSALFESVPRGTYQVRIYGSGISFTRPVSISRDNVFEVEVISWLDLALVGAVVLLFAVSLALVGRRGHVALLGRRTSRWFAGQTGSPLVLLLVLLVSGLLLALSGQPAARADRVEPVRAQQQDGPPTFAYYYIWYQPTSWLRAKRDYPLLGRYSSDDALVMERHVSMAQAAGLDGFLVSWKRRHDLDDRLDKLVGIAKDRDFELGIVYQGLDFARHPRPVAKIREDLRYFADRYGDSPVFDTFGRPVVVITGTEKYTVAQLDRATAPVRESLQVLASAKSVEDYQRTADVMDGDAYYWSSAHPNRPFYGRKLQDMSEAVRRDGGLWLAPAAAGFDSRMIGGEQVVARRGGQTLRRALAEARASRPDGVAVISWNEFSENSHVEPSEELGTEALAALADELGGSLEVPARWDRLHSVPERRGLTGWGALVALLLVGVVVNVTLALRRQSRASLRGTPPAPVPPGAEESGQPAEGRSPSGRSASGRMRP